MNYAYGWDENSAKAVAATVDAATRVRHPDLGADIHYAFVHVTHGWIESWWETHKDTVTDAVLDQVPCEWHVANWACGASMHAALCMELPCTTDLVVGLAVPAAAYMHAQANPAPTIEPPHAAELDVDYRPGQMSERVYWSHVDAAAKQIRAGQIVLVRADVTEGRFFPKTVIRAGEYATVVTAPRRGDVTIESGGERALVSRRRVGAWMVASVQEATSWAH